MDKKELRTVFAQSSEQFSSAVQNYLSSCPCDADTKAALDEIARQCFYALTETQNAIMKYIEEN